MPTEELVKIAVVKFIDVIAILIASYFWLVIKSVKRDVDGVAENNRSIQRDVERLEDVTTCLKIEVGKIKQQIDDNRELCDHRHKKD